MESASSAFARIEVTGGSFIVDAADEQAVRQHSWNLTKAKSGRLYAVNGKLGSLARWLMNAPDDKHVDHRNGNTLDNRKSNLRICTHQQNQWNRKRSPGKSRFKGVTHYKNGVNGKVWMARVECNGKRYFLGQYVTQLEAALAYDKAAVELFGEYAAPNFPERFKTRPAILLTEPTYQGRKQLFAAMRARRQQ